MRRRLLQNDFDFFRIHFDFVSFHNQVEIFDLVNWKFAFVNVSLQICIAQTSQYLFDMFYVFFFEIAIDENIVDVSENKIIEIIKEYVVHIMLIRDEFVAQIERQYSIFICVEFDSERREIFWFSVCYSNAMKCLSNV